MEVTDQMVEEARELYRKHKEKGDAEFMTIAREVVRKHGATEREEMRSAISDLTRKWATKRSAKRRDRFFRGWSRNKAS